MDDPTRHLTAPTAPQPTAETGYINLTQLLDYASPTAWLNTAIADMTGRDVLQTVVQPFAGDWARIGEYGDALTHLAACLGDVAVQTEAHAALLTTRWTGNAAEQAFTYFSDVAAGVSRTSAIMSRAAHRYSELALDVWMIATQLQNLLQSICDQAVLALLEMAAGTALVETGIGAVVGYGLATVQIINILKLITKASTIIQSAATAITMAFAFLAALLKEFGDPGQISLPDHAYTGPVAAR
ncbi:hypothetical protein [Hamadaea tsunoensis]|uniref:hypothetical protein n=1 Tax=Hamadaea tsunoensis TaxID=53368 RepID=UPI000402050C|nr:hypothetical protein [Hamadaea tsunoensis]